MSNQNVVIDADSDSVIPLNSQSPAQITANPNVPTTDTSLLTKFLGKENNPVKAEIDKIGAQALIIREMSKANADVATFIENQKKQLEIDFQRILNSFNGIMSDLHEQALLIRAQKLIEIASSYSKICEGIKQNNFPEKIEEELIVLAKDDWKNKNSIIISLFNGQSQRNNNITLY